MLRWFRKRELHAITGRSVLMYPLTAASQRLTLVRLTSAAGYGVFVVGKHEVKFVLSKSNQQSLVSWIYYFFQVILFWLSTQLCFINDLFINRNTALTSFFFYIHLTELFAFVFISYYISILLSFYFYNGYSLKLILNKKRQTCACHISFYYSRSKDNQCICAHITWTTLLMFYIS